MSWPVCSTPFMVWDLVSANCIGAFSTRDEAEGFVEHLRELNPDEGDLQIVFEDDL